MSIFDEQINRKPDLESRKNYFLKKAKEKHGDLYSYVNVEYFNSKTKVEIICSKHGSFFQQPNHHMLGSGCSKCGREKVGIKFEKKINKSQIEWLKNNSYKYSCDYCANFLNLDRKTLRKIIKRDKLPIQFWRDVNHNPNLYHKNIKRFFWDRLLKGAETRSLEVKIDINDVWELYNKQNKRCALSGQEIFFGSRSKNTTASVDRIDSNIGYTINNIQLIHKDLNAIKMGLKNDIFIDWCKKIAEYQNNL